MTNNELQEDDFEESMDQEVFDEHDNEEELSELPKANKHPKHSVDESENMDDEGVPEIA